VKTKICALLLAAALLFSLSGCSSAPVVMRYEKTEITANMYRYWLSTYKGTYMTSYSDMRDTDEFWNQIMYDDVTAEEYLTDEILTNVKRTLICTASFDSLGLNFPEEAEKEIDAYIESLVTERADGSRKAFNQELARYGININMLREIYIMQDKIDLLFSYLYVDNGPNALKSEDYEKYCRENYVHIRHIYVNDAYAYELTENGSYVRDSNGTIITRELTAEEAAAKEETIRSIENAIRSGESFESIYTKYSEDHYYKNGYYLSRSTDFIPSVISAAFSLDIGESTRVDSDFGTHFIMRLEMDSEPYLNEENADFFPSFFADAKSNDFMDWLDEHLSEVFVDTEALLPYSLRDAIPNYSI